MKQREYNSDFIEKMVHKLVIRYILFISAVNKLKVDRELYVRVLREVGCDNSYAQFLNLISRSILRGIRSKMRKLALIGTSLFDD
jgi:hypothetical protein